MPWVLLFQAVMLARERWTRLTPGERAHLASIVRKSGGRPGNLTAAERDDVRRLAAKLDVVGALRDLSPLGRRLRRRR
jgi:hypothetical protein